MINKKTVAAIICATPAWAGAQSGEMVAFSEQLFSMSIEDLLQVEVTTVSKTRQHVSEVPASVTVIGRDQIRSFGYRSLDETLSHVVGLYRVDNFGSNGTAIGINGFLDHGNKQVAVLVNGVSQGDITYEYNNLRSIKIPMEAIDRIEVVRGAHSVIYGSGAFFGVINIITRDPDVASRDHDSRVSLTAGDHAEAGLFARVEGGSADGFNYSLNASANRSDGFDWRYSDLSNSYADYGVDDRKANKMRGSSGRSLDLQLGWRDWSIDLLHQEGDQRGFFMIPNMGDDGVDYITRTSSLKLGYQTTLAEDISLQANLIHRDQSYENDYLPQGIHGDAEAGDQADLREHGAEVILDYPLGSRNHLTGGAEWNHIPSIRERTSVITVGVPTTTVKLEDPRSTLAIFGQWTHALSDELTMVTGLRGEWQSDYSLSITTETGSGILHDQRDFSDETLLMPRLGLIWLPAKDQSVKLLYGESVMGASVGQNVVILGYNNATQLESEQIRSLEIEYMRDFGSHTALKLRAYRSHLSHLIERSFVMIDGAFGSAYANSGKQVSQGLSAELDWSPSHDWQLFAGAAWQRVEDRNSGSDTNYSPDWLGYARALYHLESDITIALDGRYVDTMESSLTRETGGMAGWSSDPVVEVGLNLVFERLAGVDGLSLDLRVTNLFDRDNRFPIVDDNPWIDRGIPADGRQISATIGMSF